MTIPARRDPAAEALQLAAYRMQEGPYRGYEIVFRPISNVWEYIDTQDMRRIGTAKTQPAARRAVDELLSKETRV